MGFPGTTTCRGLTGSRKPAPPARSAPSRRPGRSAPEPGRGRSTVGEARPPMRCSARSCAGPPNDRPADPDATDRQGSPGGAVRRVPVMVHADHLRPVREGPHAIRDAHAAGRHADPRHHRPHAPRRRRRRAGKVELLTGIEGASGRPVRRIVLVNTGPDRTLPVKCFSAPRPSPRHSPSAPNGGENQ
jgi:hypothetical protein